MKILVTGSEGFIGGHLTKKLRDLDHEVFGIDIKNSSSEDIRDLKNCETIISNYKPQIIIHLAALAGVRKSLENPKQYFETNITGSYNILKVAELHGVTKTLVASSSSVYGLNPSPLNEEMICDNPISPYAISKKAMELVCKMFSKNNKIIIFRPFTVYGENGRKDMAVDTLIDCARNHTEFKKFGDGNSSRGYTNIHDLCDGVMKLIEYDPPNNFDIFNLGGNETIALNELIEIVKSQYTDLKVKEVEKNELDLFNSIADISKAERLLGWKPVKNFREEIIKLCNQAI